MKNEYLELYNRYKDNFALFKEECPGILEKHPEAVGDWDHWLLSTGISLIEISICKDCAIQCEDSKYDIIICCTEWKKKEQNSVKKIE